MGETRIFKLRPVVLEDNAKVKAKSYWDQTKAKARSFWRPHPCICANGGIKGRLSSL